MDPKEKKELAEAVVDAFLQRLYVEIGKSLMKKVFWGLIIFAISLAVMTGVVHLPGIN